jgi:hypothetical protein
MKKIAIFLSISMILGLAILNTTVKADNTARIVNKMDVGALKVKVLKKVEDDYNNYRMHVCHMNAVYFLAKKGAHGYVETMIWNFEKNRPLKCEEYDSYVNNLLGSNADE